MIALPTTPSKPTSYQPKLMILFGKPKSGKSSIMASLPNNLIIDLEDGYRALSGLIVQARSTGDLGEIVKLIKAKTAETGTMPYKYITIDNATRLEEMCMNYAIQLYKATPMGKTWVGTDIRTLPQGAGYAYLRQAVKNIISAFQGLSETLILVAHVKDKQIKFQSEEMSEMSVDLSGKLGDILCGEADAIGYVYRTKNETHISFEGGADAIREARPLHLRGKNFTVITSDNDNNLTIDLSNVFPDDPSKTAEYSKQSSNT